MNLQETPTAELVEIIRKRAEAWEKPDGLIWNELMTRYRWIGCPKEDRDLIRSLDSVLRPLNNGRTMFPPGLIQVPGAGIPPPPPYYRNKVGLSQVANIFQRPAPGQRFGQWTLKGDRPLGRGGNGVVWLAENHEGKQGAIKFFDRDGLEKRFDKSQVDAREKRFRDEIEFQTQESERRGILRLIDSSLRSALSKTELLWFVTPLAMPFAALKLSGSENLANLVRKMEVISQTLAALHEQEKWHRDLHPGNLFLLNDEPVIGDFGLVDFPGKEPVTGDIEQLGARNFVAPEMRENAGQARADKADVFSFAKTFWVLATGKRFPPDGQLRMETAELRFSTFCSHDYAHVLDLLIERSTAFNPGGRPTMREFSNELTQWLKVGLASAPASLDLSALAAECRGVFEPAIIEEANQKRMILDAQSILVSFNTTLERMSVDMMKITNLVPKSGDTYLYERLHFPELYGGAKVLWRGAREVRITTQIDPVEIFLHGYVQIEALSDNRIRILVGYLVQPLIRGQLIIAPDTWKKESIADIGSAQLMNDMSALKVKLLENLPQAIREYASAVKQQFRS